MPLARIAVVLGCLTLIGCTTVGRLTTYGLDPVTVPVEAPLGHTIMVSVHPHDHTLALQPKITAIGYEDWPLSVWRGAAENFVRPAGCGISEVYLLDKTFHVAWEAKYVCPPGVDLIQLTNAQAAGLRAGAPLHP